MDMRVMSKALACCIADNVHTVASRNVRSPLFAVSLAEVNEQLKQQSRSPGLRNLRGSDAGQGDEDSLLNQSSAIVARCRPKSGGSASTRVWALCPHTAVEREFSSPSSNIPEVRARGSGRDEQGGVGGKIGGGN